MSASAFEILSTKWEDKETLFTDIALACKRAELYFLYSRKEIVLKLEVSSERSLVLDLRDQENLKWYFDRYPMAKDEPEERIPYYIFNDFLGGQKFFSIVMANNYLDSLLIWKFSIEYLKINPSHYISIDREIFFNSEELRELEHTSGFAEGWCFKKDSLTS
ncbi:MAG: hypothetical protein DHS20C18_24830 [Saprospiraceae bacterium]|nr:MAG: hypothetical protein DHS20C18_24830 [Saprospiraceae bacterium]